jgi:hypothetical protein
MPKNSPNAQCERAVFFLRYTYYGKEVRVMAYYDEEQKKRRSGNWIIFAICVAGLTIAALLAIYLPERLF